MIINPMSSVLLKCVLKLSSYEYGKFNPIGYIHTQSLHYIHHHIHHSIHLGCILLQIHRLQSCWYLEDSQSQSCHCRVLVESSLARPPEQLLGGCQRTFGLLGLLCLLLQSAGPLGGLRIAQQGLMLGSLRSGTSCSVCWFLDC